MYGRALLIVLVPLVAACAGAAAGVTPSASVTTAIQGWEHWFRVEWTVQARASGQEIDGYIYNTYGAGAANVQILAQGLDGAGNVVTQRLEWVPGIVPPLQRSYFRIPSLAPAAQYRVSVWAFDFVQSGTCPQC
jgi:hypothetical protein